MNRISVAADFTPYPGGRFKSSGDGSGELFREKFLVPIMESNSPTSIVLDGTSGYPPSFLEEAFGGLVRLGYPASEIRRLIDIQASSSFESYKLLIEKYITDAAARAK